MNVQMKDRLTGIGAVIYRQPEGVAKSRIARHFAGSQQQVPQKLSVFDPRIAHFR